MHNKGADQYNLKYNIANFLRGENIPSLIEDKFIIHISFKFNVYFDKMSQGLLQASIAKFVANEIPNYKLYNEMV